jgi:hypothetical protein
MNIEKVRKRIEFNISRNNSDKEITENIYKAVYDTVKRCSLDHANLIVLDIQLLIESEDVDD